MNNKRIGKFAVTAIVGVLSAISGIVGVEMMKSVKKDIEKTENGLKDSISELNNKILEQLNNFNSKLEKKNKYKKIFITRSRI